MSDFPYSLELSPWADTIHKAKYSFRENQHTSPTETWAQTCVRVGVNVMAALGYAPDHPMTKKIILYMQRRQFLPGGRYLYAAGRPYHQVQNCLLDIAEDSREGWAELMYRATTTLMSGAGYGAVYSLLRARGTPIAKTGGDASGPLPLAMGVNDMARGIRQGGARRAAIWGGLHWWHPDIMEWITSKDWSDEVKALKAKNFDFPAPLDHTNISVALDGAFFDAYHDPSNPKHALADKVYWDTVRHMFTTAEPGFSVDVGDNEGEWLRNAPVSADTRVLTGVGYQYVRDIVDVPTVIWTGKNWAEGVVFKKTAEMVPTVRVNISGGRSIVCDPSHEFILDGGARVAAEDLKAGDSLMVSLPVRAESLPTGEDVFGFEEDPEFVHDVEADMYTLGFLYGDGSFTSKGRAEVTLCTDEKREKCKDSLTFCSDLKHTITYPDSRGYMRIYYAQNPLFANRTKERVGADVMLSDHHGQKLSFLAGLFDADGSYDPKQHRIRLGSKHRSFLEDVQRLLEEHGILASINVGSKSGYTGEPQWTLVINAEYVSSFKRCIPTARVVAEEHTAYRKTKLKVLSVEDDEVQDVFCCDVKLPEHSFMAEGVIISNCTEITSKDGSDICNLGSINLARIRSKEEFEDVVEAATLFLLAGTVYSHVPYKKVEEVREKNRRLGLGVMGVHEWLLVRGKKYAQDAELASWLESYTKSTEIAARFAAQHGLSAPVKTRAIAPTGTIGIVGETTTGIEPIFCVAYKRRFIGQDNSRKYQYVIDPTAARLIASGVKPGDIEDAYSLDFEQRVSFQAWMQQYVDHGISSTINLPEWGSEKNNEDTLRGYGETLMKYLPKLRGITAYPDNARGGQPLNRVDYYEAAGMEGVTLDENEDRCKGGSCGI